MQWMYAEAKNSGVPLGELNAIYSPVGLNGPRTPQNEFEGNLGFLWTAGEFLVNPISFKDTSRTVFYSDNPLSEYDFNMGERRVNIEAGVVNPDKKDRVISVGYPETEVSVPNYIIPSTGNSQNAEAHFEYIEWLQEGQGQPLVYEKEEAN